MLRRDVGKWAPGEERDRRWNRLELGLKGDIGREHGGRFKKGQKVKRSKVTFDKSEKVKVNR